MVLLFRWLTRTGNWCVLWRVVMACKEMMWQAMWRPSAVSLWCCMERGILKHLKFVGRFWCLGWCLRNWTKNEKPAKNRCSLIPATQLREHWSCRILPLWHPASWMHTFIICLEIICRATVIMKIWKKRRNGDLKFLILLANAKHCRKYLISSNTGMWSVRICL